MRYYDDLPCYSHIDPRLPFRRGRCADPIDAFGHANLDVALLDFVREAVRIVGVDRVKNPAVECEDALRVGAVATGDDDGGKAAVCAAGYVLRPARCQRTRLD